MPKKGEPMSEELKAKLAAGRAAKKAEKQAEQTQTSPQTQNPAPVDAPTEAGSELNIDQLTKMVLELQQALIRNQNNQAPQGQQGISVGASGRVQGVNTLHSTDLSVYDDPTPQLLAEPRLKRIAFDQNYELNYTVSMTQTYEKKDGFMERQPQFNIELVGIVLDDQGEPTQKRYIARKMTWFEDPATAMVVAQQNGLKVDDFGGEQEFLNAMRYLRVRDWLFEFFWRPKDTSAESDFRDEVIGGQVVRTFQKSVDADRAVSIDYSGLAGSKFRA